MFVHQLVQRQHAVSQAWGRILNVLLRQRANTNLPKLGRGMRPLYQHEAAKHWKRLCRRGSAVAQARERFGCKGGLVRLNQPCAMAWGKLFAAVAENYPILKRPVEVIFKHLQQRYQRPGDRYSPIAVSYINAAVNIK